MNNYYKYKKYKAKYLDLLNGGEYNNSINNDVYYQIKGKYNGCSIILFSPNTIYDWNNTEINENNKPNFFKKLSDITLTFAYDFPYFAASKVIHKHRKGIKFPKKSELDYKSHIEKIYKILKQNNVKGPYVLIGHSLSAFDCLVFAKKYPKETKAVILLDGTRHCDKMLENSKKGLIGSTIIKANDNDMQEIVTQFIKTKSKSVDEQIELDFLIENEVIVEKIKSWNGKLKTEIIKKFTKGPNTWKDKQIEILLSINNTAFIEQIKNWNQVPDRLDNIQIVGLWNIWIIDSAKYKNMPLEKKYNAQIEFLETMKEYHEILEKENKDNYDSYFFFDKSHNLHHSNTNEVINIISKYIL